MYGNSKWNKSKIFSEERAGGKRRSKNNLFHLELEIGNEATSQATRVCRKRTDGRTGGLSLSLNIFPSFLLPIAIRKGRGKKVFLPETSSSQLFPTNFCLFFLQPSPLPFCSFKDFLWFACPPSPSLTLAVCLSFLPAIERPAGLFFGIGDHDRADTCQERPPFLPSSHCLWPFFHWHLVRRPLLSSLLTFKSHFG